MLKLKIDNKFLNIPTELKEISIQKAIQIMHYVEQETLSLEDKATIISVLSNIDPQLINKFSEETLNKIFENLTLFSKTQQLICLNTFKLKGTIYALTNFKFVSVEDYANIDRLLISSDFPLENLHKIMNILYRKAINKKYSLRNILINIVLKFIYKNVVPYTLKSYKIDPAYDEESDIFLKYMDAGSALAAYSVLGKYRESITKDFPTLFPKISIEDADQYDDPDIVNVNKGKSLNEVWGLYSVVDQLSVDIFERTEWWKRDIRELFTFLTYMNQKNQQIKAE